MSVEPDLVVAEVFGPTFQGEGPSLGRRAGFVRLGGCNLHCKWCDTPYTWDASRYDLRNELKRTPVVEIVAQIGRMHPAIVVITGGEPLLWSRKPAWTTLLDALASVAPIEIETNGTIAPAVDDPVNRYNVSPKLSHAGDPRGRRIIPAVLERFALLAADDRSVMKVVVRAAEDVRQVARLAQRVQFPLSQVYVMPEATDTETLLRRHRVIADAAIAEGLNVTTRLHLMSWGNQRGR